MPRKPHECALVGCCETSRDKPHRNSVSKALPGAELRAGSTVFEHPLQRCSLDARKQPSLGDLLGARRILLGIHQYSTCTVEKRLRFLKQHLLHEQLILLYEKALDSP